jgi:hypothetical protein
MSNLTYPPGPNREPQYGVGVGMGGAPGEGVTLDGSVGAVGDEFPPQATYPRASRSKNTIARSFFIFNLLTVIPFSAAALLLF